MVVYSYNQTYSVLPGKSPFKVLVLMLEIVLLKFLVLQTILLSILLLVPELILDLVLDPNIKPLIFVPTIKE